MYCYIDEQRERSDNPYFTIVALVIGDRRSKQVISQAVARAITDIRKHGKNPSKRIPELKGRKHWRQHPSVCIRFLKRIRRKAKFHLYLLRFHKRNPKQPLPTDPDRAYNLILSNIFSYIHISKGLRLLTVVADSRADATPISKNDKA